MGSDLWKQGDVVVSKTFSYTVFSQPMEPHLDPPLVWYELPERRKKEQVPVLYRDAGVNTDITGVVTGGRVTRIKKEKVQLLEQKCTELKEKEYFCLNNIGDDSNGARF